MDLWRLAPSRSGRAAPAFALVALLSLGCTVPRTVFVATVLNDTDKPVDLEFHATVRDHEEVTLSTQIAPGGRFEQGYAGSWVTAYATVQSGDQTEKLTFTNACAFYRVRNGPTGLFTQGVPEPNRK